MSGSQPLASVVFSCSLLNFSLPGSKVIKEEEIKMQNFQMKPKGAKKRCKEKKRKRKNYNEKKTIERCLQSYCKVCANT